MVNLRQISAFVAAFLTSWRLCSALAPSSYSPNVVRGSFPHVFSKPSLHQPRPSSALTAIAFDPRYRRQQGNNLQQRTEERFDRTASQEAQAQAPCIMEIDGVHYNLTAWAKAHPGGEKILLKFHDKDATKAFHAAGHSKKAVEMLKDFAITDAPAMMGVSVFGGSERVPRWRKKLFTREDPIGVHKYMGIFVLFHFLFRFRQMFFGDPSCGLGTRLGKGPSLLPALCLIPHALLSLSSLIFHTVPRERVVGRPMIWSEFRVHNIAFGLRSVVAAGLAWASYYFHHSAPWRAVALWGSGVSIVLAQIVADLGTKYLRVNNQESTTATMPYWEGCSVETQKRFKSFYAYCQFMATLACLACGNPAWPLCVLLAIQMASLLMTLVRKGLLSARGYHIGYTITLIMPWFVGLRSLQHGPDMVWTATIGWILYQLRRRGINKYALWVPVIAARSLWGDQFYSWNVY